MANYCFLATKEKLPLTVDNSNNHPLQGANIALSKQNESHLVTGTIT